jgi:hypothetical protein
VTSEELAATPGAFHGWFGDPAIWAAVQLPTSGSLGVVICTPLGQEGVVAYRGLRYLADQLQQRGIASVRYDPAGRGDGAPTTDPTAPMLGARAAAEVLRGTGCRQIAYLGLSSAALLASAAAQPGDLLVLWSPPQSGRQWLRRARSLATMMIGVDRTFDDYESLIGLDLTADQADFLEQISLALPGQAPALVASRPGERVPSKLAAAEQLEVPGTAEFLDTSSVSSVMPVEAITTIADWLAAHVSEPGHPLTAPALTAELDLGGTVERIRWLGPNRLFAIECSPRATTDATPVVVLHAGASEHRVGAGDYQVELARLLAAEGVRSLRVDRRGAGETGAVSPDEPSLFYTQTWLDDQDTIVEATGVVGDQLAVAGLCAGAWMAGLPMTVDPRLVVGIHPLEYRVDPAQPNEFVEEVVLPREVSGRLMLWAQRVYRRWAPVWLRRLRARTGSKADPSVFLNGLAKRTWRTVLIFSEVDQEVFRRLGGPEISQRLPGIVLVDVPTIDHPMFARRTRVGAIERIRAYVREAFDLPEPSAG